MKSSFVLKCIACLLLASPGSARVFAAEGAAPASPEPAAPSNPARSLSATAAGKRAAWQQHLTLGPGDTLNISLFDVAETARRAVPIGPDGRITFLEAQDVQAAGLTIDELRAKLDAALTTYYRTPRTIIAPERIRSKKFFILGAVATKGVFELDRPLTIIEAIARAGGLETGLYEQRTVELADLPRSFMVRNRQRVAVDFERLFQRGDLSQNVVLEPDDYIYFASATVNEIYVLGEVGSPGTVTFAQDPTVLKVIATRGGFTEKAWKQRVLVVRGSLNHPEGVIVDTRSILSGKAADYKLRPRDIVYVHANPWTKVEDLVDLAARAFIQGMLVEYTTLKVGPIFTEPLIK